MDEFGAESWKSQGQGLFSTNRKTSNNVLPHSTARTMQQVYWLYPKDVSKLIAEVIRYFARLLPDGRPAAGIESLQVEINGAVQFLAGDAFHDECISVGPGVPESLLKAWIRAGVISGYYTRDDFKKFLDRRDGVA